MSDLSNGDLLCLGGTPIVCGSRLEAASNGCDGFVGDDSVLEGVVLVPNGEVDFLLSLCAGAAPDVNGFVANGLADCLVCSDCAGFVPNGVNDFFPGASSPCIGSSSFEPGAEGFAPKGENDVLD